MANQNLNARWYPTPSTPRSEVDRQIFERIYALADRPEAAPASATASPPNGLSTTVTFAGGFTVGATTYYNMTFRNGILVGIS